MFNEVEEWGTAGVSSEEGAHASVPSEEGKKEINEIQRALEDIKKGRVYPIEIVARELGISTL